MSKTSKKLTSSQTNEHYTPTSFLSKVSNFFHNQIDLDPSSNSKMAPQVPARLHYTAEENGLSLPWYGNTFCNPPYGRVCPHFVDKAIAEYEDHPNELEILMLLKSATDTRWYQRLAGYPRCNILGRLKFESADGTQTKPATFPSVLFFLGSRVEEFWEFWEPMGEIVIPIGLMPKIEAEKNRI
jgi:hypothetical protein